MVPVVDVYYDFRSPYAYFASCRIAKGLLAGNVRWQWQPVSIDVLLNLQAGREPWAAYVDPLPAPKRAHLIADVRRIAAFHGIPLKAPKPPRQDSVPALCAATLVRPSGQDSFRTAVFEALWQEQLNIAEADVLTTCLAKAGVGTGRLDWAFSAEARSALAETTVRAYAIGVFGVPSFVSNGEIFFGNDRLDVLAWRLNQ